MKEWVSIMVPCFNGELFLDSLLECLINQTYDKLHIIIINDGSTDESEEIIMNYKQSIDMCGKRLTYYKQENKGLASAINTALLFVDSEYVTWMDVDDRISKNHIEKMLNALIAHPEYEWVSCKGLTYNEGHFDNAVGELGIRQINDEINFAEDLLFHRTNCSPGLYMLRTDAFLKANGGKNIYCTNRVQGQNMQMLLPMAFLYGKPYYLESFLFHYTIRESSLSHVNQGNISNMMKYTEHIKMIKDEVIETNSFISLEYKAFLHEKYVYFDDKWKLNILFSCKMEEAACFIKIVFDKYLYAEKIRNRCVRIWGYYADGMYLHDVLKYIYPQYEFGYVESNLDKCGTEVLYKDNIDKDNDYIISLLNHHIEIDKLLDEKKFVKLNDYLYFEREICAEYDG